MNYVLNIILFVEIHDLLSWINKVARFQYLDKQNLHGVPQNMTVGE